MGVLCLTMVEKGDKSLDLTPSSSVEEGAISDIPPPMVPRATTVTERTDDSDDDFSESEEEERSQATADTTVVGVLKVIGQAKYDDGRCLVILSQKVDGHELYCGYPKGSCSRPKHRRLQQVPSRRGRPGIYQQLPNGKGLVHDAVADTWVTPEEVAEQRSQNRTLLSSLGKSPENERSELQAKPKATPIVRVDTNIQSPGPRAERIAALSKGLPETPRTRTAFSQPASQTLPEVTTASEPMASSSDSAMIGLLTHMIARFDRLADTQAELVRDNARILQCLETQTTLSVQQQRDLEELRRTRTQPPASPDLPIPGSVSVTSHDRPKAQRYYAVARGRSVGVFHLWKAVEKSVNGYSGAKHKRFRTLNSAKAWLAANTDSRASGGSPDNFSDDDVTVNEPRSNPAIRSIP
jgi:hypothetical protein